MSATLCFLAITVLGTILTGTVKADPKEEAILKYLAELPQEDTKTAVVIRDRKVQSCGLPFKKAAHSNAKVVDLVLNDTPDIRNTRLQIKLSDDGPVFGSLHTISLEVYEDDQDQQQTRLILHFDSASSDPFKLYVPVFEIPPMYIEDETRFPDWEKAKQVEGINSLNDPALFSLAEGKVVRVYFNWLSRLVPHGLYRYQLSSSGVFTAWTRPVVVRPEVLREFINLWNNFKGTGN